MSSERWVVDQLLDVVQTPRSWWIKIMHNSVPLHMLVAQYIRHNSYLCTYNALMCAY